MCVLGVGHALPRVNGDRSTTLTRSSCIEINKSQPLFHSPFFFTSLLFTPPHNSTPLANALQKSMDTAVASTRTTTTTTATATANTFSAAAAATAISSADPRIQPHQDQVKIPSILEDIEDSGDGTIACLHISTELQKRRRWGGCLSGFLCFVPSKTGKRIVPASRTPDTGMPGIHVSGNQSIDISNQASTFSLLAPPSSPASFSNSGLPSTVQSPSSFLSLSTGVFSPGGPASTMFTTGPYAHETQLVSPPAFSNFTTEPSTAPVTPPPELVQMTTPSSPDVPYAKLLFSTLGVDNESKECSVSSPPFMPSCYVAAGDLATYQLYPGSPTSYLVSPNPGNPKDDSCLSFPAQEAFFPSKLFGVSVAISKSCLQPEDPNFPCSPQFYLDQALQSCVDDSCDMEVEQHSEAYRASFGFSSEEIVNAKMHYTGLSDAPEGSLIVSHLAAAAAAAAHCLSQGECARSNVGNAEKKHMGHLNSAVSRILDPSSEI